MSVPKHRLLGGWYPRGLIIHQQKYRPSDSNKNVDFKFSDLCVGYDDDTFSVLILYKFC
jgi:hypothetical protein